MVLLASAVLNSASFPSYLQPLLRLLHRLLLLCPSTKSWCIPGSVQSPLLSSVVSPHPPIVSSSSHALNVVDTTDSQIFLSANFSLEFQNFISNNPLDGSTRISHRYSRVHSCIAFAVFSAGKVLPPVHQITGTSLSLNTLLKCHFHLS